MKFLVILLVSSLAWPAQAQIHGRPDGTPLTPDPYEANVSLSLRNDTFAPHAKKGPTLDALKNLATTGGSRKRAVLAKIYRFIRSEEYVTPRSRGSVDLDQYRYLIQFIHLTDLLPNDSLDLLTLNSIAESAVAEMGHPGFSGPGNKMTGEAAVEKVMLQYPKLEAAFRALFRTHAEALAERLGCESPLKW